MERTELVEKFKTETGCSLERARKTGKVALLKADYIKWLEAQIPTGDKIAVSAEYLRGLEEKAEAYDRLMSGKARMTMQEMANFIGRPITIGRDGGITAHGAMPRLETTQTGKFWYNEADEYMEINESFVDFSGDWKNSLTLPDGWEEAK